jgi:hypothetical protein
MTIVFGRAEFGALKTIELATAVKINAAITRTTKPLVVPIQNCRQRWSISVGGRDWRRWLVKRGFDILIISGFYWGEDANIGAKMLSRRLKRFIFPALIYLSLLLMLFFTAVSTVKLLAIY